MADNDRRDEEQPKVTVRDRRRVNVEGDLREVPTDEAPAAPPPPPSAPQPPPAEAPRKPRGGALGGVESARVNRQDARLREVPEVEAPEEEPAGGEMPAINTVYDYVQAVASEMTIWSLAALGLMANPITRIVTTDMAQAQFAIDTADTLVASLAEQEQIDDETRAAIYQSFVIQFASVAAQLLNQPAQVRLAEIAKIRFCIDTADHFVQRMQEVEEVLDEAQLDEMKRLLSELRFRFVQASGGGGIVG